MLLVLVGAAAVRADGGWVCAKQPVGGWIVSIFVAPVPVRAGPIDVSVMVQDANGEMPILDADVSLVVSSSALGAQPLTLAATRAQASNKLLYAAQLILPAAGQWKIEANVARGAETVKGSCALIAEAAPPPILAYWPYLALPPVVIVLFILNQWLGAERLGPRHSSGPSESR